MTQQRVSEGDLERSRHRSPLRGYESRPLSYGQIETIAWSVRSALLPKLSETGAVPGVTLFESLDRISVERRDGSTIPLNYGVGRLPGNFEAWTRHDAGRGEILIVLDEMTYGRLRGSNPRALFTLAHEIGHAVLHVDDLVRLSRMAHDISRPATGAALDHEIFRDTEFHANAFAAAFLMPAVGLAVLERRAQRLTTELIRDTFHVSPSAAEIRRDVYGERRDELLRAVLPSSSPRELGEPRPDAGCGGRRAWALWPAR